MRGTKEMYDLMDAFEKACRSSLMVRTRLDRAENPVHQSEFYEHGETNELFRAFMHGYMLSKSLHNEATR